MLHVRADKGNSMDKMDYSNTNIRYLQENNSTEMKKDPTDKFQRKRKQIIKESQKYSKLSIIAHVIFKHF